jgi:hypothetical protein
MRALALLIPAFLVMACDGGTDSAPAAGRDGLPEVDTIVVCDTLGLEMGDSCYVFGYISDAATTPDGGVVLLDRVTGRVSLFDPENSFVTSFGGKGEAPDHFQWPLALAILGDGRIAVKDGMGGDVALFSADGEVLRRIRGDARIDLTFRMEALGDSSWLTYGCPSRMAEGSFRQGYEVRVDDPDEATEPTTVFSHTYVVGEDDFDFQPGYLCVTSDHDGRIYLHRMARGSYLIEVLDRDGAPIDSIVSDSIEIPLEDAPLFYSIPVATFSSTDGEGNTVRSRGENPANAPQVAGLGIDSAGNLWARRGTAYPPVFDVFSPEGDKLGEVVATGLADSSFVRFHIGPGGVIAWDLSPEDYPKVYRFEAR